MAQRRIVFGLDRYRRLRAQRAALGSGQIGIGLGCCGQLPRLRIVLLRHCGLRRFEFMPRRGELIGGIMLSVGRGSDGDRCIRCAQFDGRRRRAGASGQSDKDQAGKQTDGRSGTMDFSSRWCHKKSTGKVAVAAIVRGRPRACNDRA